MKTPEEIQKDIDNLQARLVELQKQKEELEKPLTVTLTNILFTGMGGIFEIKFSKQPDNSILDKIRFIPSRNYIAAREVNQFKMDDLSRVVYELKESNLDLIISDEFSLKITEWNNTPDFRITLEEKRKQIKISKTIRQKRLPYIHSLNTFTEHTTNGYYTFSVNELLDWMKLQLEFEKNYKLRFEISEEVNNLYKDQVNRENLTNEFAEMKDAPEFDYVFPMINPATGEPYNLKPDQRVACKFDATFGGRSLISFDMGKGKTAISIAQAERYNERVLYICKADLKTNIKREIKKFTGKDAIVFSGIEPSGVDVDLMIVKKSQYNILNYEVVGRSIKDEEAGIELMKWVELINFSRFDRIIYDEAHMMKNMEAQRSKGGRALKSEKVMLLTGTPIVNRPGEIFPILNIIDPVTFFDYSSFSNQFTNRDGTPRNLDTLHKILKKYMIRRLKDQSNNPELIPQYTTLSDGARINYSKVYEGLYIALRNPNYQRDVTNILTQLLRLKQICADDKVDFTVDLAETALDETVDMPWNKVLIYSQFKNSQVEIARRLENKCAIINGDVTDKARYELVDKFQDPKSGLKVIVTNIVEGLTLTNAFTTILNDLPWTPKDVSQFEGRAFGRENDPHGGNSYYVLSENTIDDLIWSILEEKRNTSKQVVDDVYTPSNDSGSMVSDLMDLLRDS